MTGGCDFIISVRDITILYLSHNEAEGCVLHDYVFMSNIKIAQAEEETVQGMRTRQLGFLAVSLTQNLSVRATLSVVS